MAGESRIDVYILLAILSHFISSEITGVASEMKGRSMAYASALLLAVFSAIVAYRVIMILHPGWSL